MTDTETTRQLAAMRTELAQVRRLIETLATTISRLTPTTDTPPEGVRTLPNGDTFIPGTGTITNHHTLSPEAQAALNQLDQDQEHTDA